MVIFFNIEKIEKLKKKMATNISNNNDDNKLVEQEQKIICANINIIEIIDQHKFLFKKSQLKEFIDHLRQNISDLYSSHKSLCDFYKNSISSYTLNNI